MSLEDELNSTALHEFVVHAGFTINDEISVIATNLNGIILAALLMGIYTVVYGGTIYKYTTREGSRCYLVPATVSALYLCNLAYFGIDWSLVKQQFVNQGGDRDTVFLATVDNWGASVIELDLLNAATLMLSESLLIWRCFNVWDRSFRIIFVPVLLTITEGALMLAQAIGAGVIPSNAFTEETRLNTLVAVGLLMSGCSTIITTALIAYRIRSFLMHQGISAKRFRHIIDVVVQSGAIYSLSVLLYGIINIHNNADRDGMNVVLFNFGLWASNFTFYLAGMSTTIMVARVAMLSSHTNINIPTSIHLTGIQFQPHSTVHTHIGARPTIDISTSDASINAAGEEYQSQDLSAEEKAIRTI
ncbi:hypothetical protein BDN70DRAFT_924594 [Pholiota conissans]|uniref:Uncharacterized protein n=1 Tax=Pholiota conissans TaxID=109636 RepID=A0A9P5YS56_9AGAR|nr:hypothetical protein BDN70DRAFT_924594 [Pholiota conissans]